MDYRLYVGCRGSDKLITLILSDGKLYITGETNAPHPMFLTESEDSVYALSLAPFDNSNESAILRFVKTSSGLNKAERICSTAGIEACHLTLFEGHLYYTNYSSGSIGATNGFFVQRHGSSINPARQEAAHPHQIIPTPDGKLAVCDLGCDTITFYDLELNPLSEINVVSGSGVRHAVFSPNGKYMYTVGELDSVVRKYRYTGGTSPSLELVAAASALTNPEESAAAAIYIDSKRNRLYTSNRGQDTISIFEFEDDLKLIGSVSCGGNCPRDFGISPDGSYLVCANELSGTLTVFTLSNELPRVSSSFVCGGNPMCVLFSRFA